MARIPNSAGASAFASTRSTTVCVTFAPQEPADSHRAPRAVRVRLPAVPGSEVAMTSHPSRSER
jgi:hypothetical protein